MRFLDLVERDTPPAVLRLLDESVAWLRARGLQQWLLWPHERDTVAAAVFRGEVWLLHTEGGDVAATVTLTAAPRAGTWDAADREVSATYVSWLAVRRDLAGRGIGGRVLDWVLLRAYRRGDFLVRTACWPGNPDLAGYLQRHGFRTLWTVGESLATARTLFVRPVAAGRAVPFAEPAVLLPTDRVALGPDDPRPAGDPGPDHAHVAPQLLVGPGTPARLVSCYRYRLREAGGWRLQGAQAAQWHPGVAVTAAGGLVLGRGVEYVLTHRDGDPCGVQVVAVRREHPGDLSPDGTVPIEA